MKTKDRISRLIYFMNWTFIFKLEMSKHLSYLLFYISPLRLRLITGIKSA